MTPRVQRGTIGPMRHSRAVEEKAAGLVGSWVRVTCKKNPDPHLNPAPYQFECHLEGVRDGFLIIKRESGMTHSVPLRDQYMVVVDVRAD